MFCECEQAFTNRVILGPQRPRAAHKRNSLPDNVISVNLPSAFKTFLFQASFSDIIIDSR